MEVGVGAGLGKKEKLEVFHHSLDLANLLRLGRKGHRVQFFSPPYLVILVS